MSSISVPPRVDPALSVNDVIARWPLAIGTLNALGIDTCCGGALSLRDAAEEAGIPVATLVTSIERAALAEEAR